VSEKSVTHAQVSEHRVTHANVSETRDMSEGAGGGGLPLSQYDANARRRGAHEGNISIAFLNMSPTLTEQRERAGAHITEESDVISLQRSMICICIYIYIYIFVKVRARHL
jgi:hypothetical protein